MTEIGSIWTELGIPPTTERAAIRRAYAARLKSMRPDVDPQGFARLRHAYEQALGIETVPSPPSLAAIPPASVEIQIKPLAATPAEDGVSNSLRRGDVVAAAEWLLAARQSATLSLQQDMRLTDTLAWSMAQDHSLHGNDIVDAAARLGWRSGDLTGPWAKALQVRLEAEHWLSEMRRDAASPTWLFARSRAIAARTLLGQGPMHGLSTMRADQLLRRRYGEFLFHAPVIGNHLDPVRLQAISKALTGPKRRDSPHRRADPAHSDIGLAASGAMKIACVYLFALVAGGIAGEIERSWQGPVTGLTALTSTTFLLVQRRRRRRLVSRDRRG